VRRRRIMAKPLFLSNQTWLPALVFTLVFAGFYFLFFSGLLIR
jgi:hypothetical protein